MHKQVWEKRSSSIFSAGLSVAGWSLYCGSGEGEDAMLWGIVGLRQEGSGTGDFNVRVLWQQDPLWSSK